MLCLVQLHNPNKFSSLFGYSFGSCRILCKAGSLDPLKVKGKILVCLRGDNARVDKGQQAALAGAVGMILANDAPSGSEILANPHVLPASHVNFTDGVAIFSSVNHTR